MVRQGIREIYICLANLLRRMRGIRYVTFVIIVCFFVDILLGTLEDNLQLIGLSGNILVFPFLQTSDYYMRVIGLGIVYVYSDVPFMEKSELFYFSRLGKKRWGRRNIFYLINSALTIALLIVSVSVVRMWSMADFSSEWGNVYKTLALTGGVGLSFEISYNVMRLFSPMKLGLVVLCLNWLVALFVGLFMYAISLFGYRRFAGIAGMLLVLMATISSWLDDVLIYVSPISWLDCSKWRFGFDMTKPDLVYIFVAVVFADIVLIILCQDRVERIEWRSMDD